MLHSVNYVPTHILGGVMGVKYVPTHVSTIIGLFQTHMVSTMS
ncbi:hypothetical protein HMPREF0183_0281 [Brevibacterium mcbrellneri ATCC 49030]|uniref:Uncharacterized protein n=1 Tax=Brevibacterium mcbrellneri ATCC 49030 TaxID=585530 RepID=D4YK21_9MICO|nr:hypothetical protein HMPREF0183_0281 [Brevibacterium mcbrellneri ATCC 49030]